MLTARDEQRLEGVHPRLVAALATAAARAEADGTPIFIVGGVRTPEFQHALWKQGRETPGPGASVTHPLGCCVTEKDGYAHRSDHQPEKDGYGHAVDFAFYGTKARPGCFDTAWPWAQVASYATAADAAVQWGGAWKKPADLDHLQLAAVSS